MWDEARIDEIGLFNIKIVFPHDYPAYNRYINKDDIETYVTWLDLCPWWHEQIKDKDKIAYFHEHLGWVLCEVIGTCTSQSTGVDELLLCLKESIGADGTCPLEA